MLRDIESRMLEKFKFLKEKIYKLRSTDYGLFEAIFFPTTIDGWTRYADVINEIRKTGPFHSILEVGAGGAGVSRFLNSPKYTIFLLDIRREAFLDVKDAQSIVADGCKLPFKDKSFDIVVSVATFEHIHKEIRHKFLGELERVCKKSFILHFPTNSKGGLYKSRAYDIKFQDIHRNLFGVDEKITNEHITAIHPTIEEVKKELPNSKIYRRKNCDVWLKYMVMSRRKFGLFTGLCYYLLWRKQDNKPPYYECMVVHNKKSR